MPYSETEFRRLVREFCEAVGIHQPEELAQSQHIVVGDRTIGLIPVDGTPPLLNICIELGQTFASRDGGVYERMLRANLMPRHDGRGRFGLHPHSGQAVYCLTLPMEDLSGSALAGTIESILEEHSVDSLEADR